MQDGLENMKIIMDEASQQSLDVLRQNLSELLDPLKELPQRFDNKLDGLKEEISSLAADTKRQIDNLEDAMDILPLRKDMRNILENQEAIVQKLDAISKTLDDFLTSFAQIDWDSPTEKSNE